MIGYHHVFNFFPYSLNHRNFSLLFLSPYSSPYSSPYVRNVIPGGIKLLLFICLFLSTVGADDVGELTLPANNGDSSHVFGSSTEKPAFLFEADCWQDSCKVIKLVPKVDLVGASSLIGVSEVVKVSCKPKSHISIDQLCLSGLPAATRILEIHNTSTTSIGPSSFANLPNLRKLDLRYNLVSHVEPDAFAELSNLRRLDLSHNKISELKSGQLSGLQQLVRLKMSNNPLRKIEAGIIEEAPSLKAIELSNTQLHCDCDLRWMVSNDEQQEGKKILRILGTPVCHSPTKLAGKKLKKLKPDRLLCDPTDLVVTKSMVELGPGLDQVVFAGDSLRLRCRVGDSENVAWKWGETVIEDDMTHGSNHSLKVNIKTIQNDDSVESFIEIPEVTWGHSGEWTCVVDGKKKKNSKSISIYVIHRQTKYCSLNVTTDNKGTYTWPRTVAKVQVDLPCQAISHYSSWVHNTSEANRAIHHCNENGHWARLDTSGCSYIMETTRILEHFSKTDLLSAKASVQESSGALRNFTRDGHIFKDPMDVVFLSRTVTQYVQLLTMSSENQQTARTLMEIIASSLSADKVVLEDAEKMNGSCSNLVGNLWELGKFLPYFSMVSTPHFSFNQISFKPDAFGEVSCVWFRKRIYSSDRSFHCGVNNSSLFYTIAEDITDARIRIPASVFTNSTDKTDNSSEAASVTLQFIAFDSAKLYSSNRKNWEVTSPVLGVRMVSGGLDSNGSVYITLRSTLYSHSVYPARWVNGSWSESGCSMIRVISSMAFFRCNGLSEYGLLQDVTDLLNGIGTKGAPFKQSPIGVYVGSALCNLLLMASIAIWCIHHQRINTQGKNKHSYVNTWIALLFLNSLFTVGIYQTESVDMCRIIGLFLHYLTTCVLLWIIVSVTNLYKKISKSFRPPAPSEDPALPPKPMFRFYLVGWGIALILCGISTAVNLDHYSTYHYCFLAWSPSLAAFYAPCVILIFILVAFFLLTHCLLRAGHEGYSETTGNTETTELELLDAVSPSSENPPSLRADDELSVFSQKSVLSQSDGQHGPMTQLKAHVVTLLLFILTWAAAGMTTGSPFSAVIPNHELIFSLIYATCATSLGLFIFMFFCAFRTDVTEALKELSLSCSPSEEKSSTSGTNNIFNSFPSSSQAQPNNQLAPTASVAIAASVRSQESTNTITNRSSSVVRSVSHKENSQSKASNVVNLLNLSVMADGVQCAPEIFYNAKQSGVARRFFHKQKLRQMMKRNNLQMNRSDSDYNSTAAYKIRPKPVANSESDVSSFDPSCLGISNKINNTNIHVDCSHIVNKSPTPELLCVFGPPKEACTIVNSAENNQHLWPVGGHRQCSPRPGCMMENQLHSNNFEQFSGEDSVLLGKRQPRLRYQPMVYSKVAYPVPISNYDSKDDNTAGTDDGADLKANFRKRHKKVVHRPERPCRKRSKTRPSIPHAEEQPGHEDDDSSSVNIDKRSNDDLATSFSPLSFSSLPCPTSCLGTPSSISPSSHHADGFSPDCQQVDWMHLIKKRVLENEEYQLRATEESLNSVNDDYNACAYAEDQWMSNASPYISDIGYRVNVQSDAETSSIATSLIPAVDTSPPGSLAVSESPFDSPLHKLHQNTPDRISLDSESHFSSRDSPDQLNVTPTRDCTSFADPTDFTVTPSRSMDLRESSDGMFLNDAADEWLPMELTHLDNFKRKEHLYKARRMKKSSSFSMPGPQNTSKLKQSSSFDMGRRADTSSN